MSNGWKRDARVYRAPRLCIRGQESQKISRTASPEPLPTDRGIHRLTTSERLGCSRRQIRLRCALSRPDLQSNGQSPVRGRIVAWRCALEFVRLPVRPRNRFPTSSWNHPTTHRGHGPPGRSESEIPVHYSGQHAAKPYPTPWWAS